MPAFKRKAPTYPWQWFDWCGPYISDGKFQSSTPGFTTARSAQEQRCKEHDIAYAKCKSRKCFEEADRKFRDDSWALGVFGKLAGTGVYHLGPLFHGNYEEEEKSEKRQREETPQEPNKRLRGNPSLSGQKRPADSSNPSQRNRRRRLNFDPYSQSDPLEPIYLKTKHPIMGTQGEVGLMPFKNPAAYAPDYFTTKLKWVCQGNVNYFDRTLFKHEFRINSPLDPNYLATDKNDVKSNATVNGWTEYSTRYKFYRVVKNRVHIKIHFPNDAYSAAGTDADMARRLALVSWPRVAGVALNPSRMFPYSDGSKVTDWSQIATSKFVDWKSSIGVGQSLDFYIDYDPLAWSTPVAEQQREVFWTPVTQNPQLQDHFTIFAQVLNGSSVMGAGSASPNLIAQYIVTMEFTVQFREWSDETIGRSLLHEIRNVNDTAGTSQNMTGSTDTAMQS